MIRKISAVLLALVLVLSIPMGALAAGVSVTQQGEVAKGETIVFEVRLADAVTAKSGAIEIDFDPAVLEVVSYEWHLTNPLLQIFDPATGMGAFAFMNPASVGDLIFTVTFKVKDAAAYGDASVSMKTQFSESGDPEQDAQEEEVESDVYVSCMTHVPGAAATCTTDQVCTVCQYVIVPAFGHECATQFGTDGTHHWPVCSVEDCDYENTDEKVAHSATGENVATCKTQAVCDVCEVSFGELNGENHVGGTSIVNASEPNHKEQTSGYTGDTKCLGCGDILAYGQPIEPGDHTPANVWSNDDQYHWKECTVVGCGIVIDGSKAPHSSDEEGNKATCQKQAVCDVCGVSYGSLASHIFTQEDMKPEAVKSEGNCRDNAVYYYSCSVCDLVESNDSHIFSGEKVLETHVGGTEVINGSEANHKTQTDGYSGDTKCLGCGEILAYGQTIPAGGHTPAAEWTTDLQDHWKVCAVSDCDEVISGTKAAHSSTGANVATCQKQAVCDVCGVSYGTVAEHDFAQDWSKDATGHWYACQTSECTEKNGFAAHTPDHDGAPSEDYAITCTACLYVIHEKMPHTHVFDKEVAEDEYEAGKANCVEPAKYYKSCKCGQKGMETFLVGTALGHTEGTEWKYDGENHWHICSVAGCGAVIETSKAAHTVGTEWKSDKNRHWNECVCGSKANTATHDDDDQDGLCDVCQRTVPPAGGPDTGDHSMNFLWIILLCVGGLGVGVTLVLRKKRVF